VALIEPRQQVPVDAEIGQKRLRCRSEKRSRDTPVTLPAMLPAETKGGPWDVGGSVDMPCMTNNIDMQG
jgi:hypothetical protein